MSNQHEEGRKARKQRKDAGPQGTQVFSREEVDQLLSDSGSDETVSGEAHIKGVSSSVSGARFALSAASIVVGRSADCKIRLEDSSVSSEHARLVRDNEGWRAINMLSTNGTFINDEKISNAPLTDGDRVRFGRVEFVFYDPDSSRHASGVTGSWKRWLPWVVVAVVVLAGLVIWLR